MLKRLGRWLRAAGYDTEIADDGLADREVMAQAVAQGRLLLTRDKQMMERRAAQAGAAMLLECNDTDSCARELSRRLGVDWLYRPFSRCMICNTPLVAAPPEQRPQVPPKARTRLEILLACPGCGRLYWDGHHVKRMRKVLESWQKKSG